MKKRKSEFKGATASYLMHYSCVVFIIFKGLCRFAFLTNSFGKPLFRLSVLPVFFVLNLVFNMCVILLKKARMNGCISDISLRRFIQRLRDISKRADLQISETSHGRLIKDVSWRSLRFLRRVLATCSSVYQCLYFLLN